MSFLDNFFNSPSDFNWYGNSNGFADYYNDFNWGSNFSQGNGDILSDNSGNTWNFWDIFDTALDAGFDELLAYEVAAGSYGNPTVIFDNGEGPVQLPPLPAEMPRVLIPTPQGIPGPDPSIFAPDPVYGPVPNPPLPGYCPSGTYHPKNDPYNCVPFSNDPAQRRAQQTAKARQGQAQARRQQQMQTPCSDPATARYPYTGKCVPRLCPQGTQRNQATGECIRVNSAQAQANVLAARNCGNGRVWNSKTQKCTTPGSETGSTTAWLILGLGAAGLLLISKSRKS